MLIAFTYLPGFVTVVFRGLPTMWRGRHRLIFCWLVFMQAVHPGRHTLEEMARWTPATITAWRFGRLLKAAYWNVHLIVSWLAQDLLATLPPPPNGVLYLFGDGSHADKRGTKNPVGQKGRISVGVLLLLALLVAPLAAEALPPHIPRIGVLWPDSSTAGARVREAFRHGLHELGYVEGQTLVVEERWAEGQLERLPALAAELVRLRVAVLVATYTPVVVAVKQTGTQLPVVFVAVSEPIEIGAVASLAHPGGNFTGLTTSNRELMPKRLELLQEALPGLTRVGYLANPTYAVHQPQLHEMQAAARALGMELHPFEVRDGAALERAFAGMAAAPVGAFIVQQDPLFTAHRHEITQLAAQSRLPGMYIASLFPYEGGLISYGAHFEDLFRRAATYVDKILKGTKPAELPVERPRKFELVINLQTAQALGLTIPPTLLFQADEVIR